ncbi:MAG: PaaI family thioesterase [Pseudomonadota bacterium]
MADKPAPVQVMREHAHLIMSAVPWAKELGFEVTAVKEARAFAKAPWRHDLVGDPEHGVIAGGVITALLDNLCGVAVAAALDEFKSMATLDLRIDYMRPATKGQDVLAEAECYHVTRSVAFCHAWAYHDDRSKMVATATASFALKDPSRLAPAMRVRGVTPKEDTS